MRYGEKEGDVKLVMINGVDFYSRSCRILTRRTSMTSGPTRVSTKNSRQVMPRHTSDLAETGRLSQQISKHCFVAEKQQHVDART